MIRLRPRRATGSPTRSGWGLRPPSGALAASKGVEVDRLVNSIGGVTLLNRLVLVGVALAWQRARLDLDGQLMHVLTQGGSMRIIVDEGLERAADLLRPSLALYIGGMAHGRQLPPRGLRPDGLRGEAGTIQDHYPTGDKKAAIAAVPKAMVEDVTLTCFWAKIADEI